MAVATGRVRPLLTLIRVFDPHLHTVGRRLTRDGAYAVPEVQGEPGLTLLRKKRGRRGTVQVRWSLERWAWQIISMCAVAIRASRIYSNS